MPKTAKYRYIFNKETLDYDLVKAPSRWKRSLMNILLYGISSVLAFFFLTYFLTDVLEIKDPKTKIIERNLSEWYSRLEIVNMRLEMIDKELEAMENRDNNIYRSIFGMERISRDVRNAGYGGVDRYAYLRISDFSGNLTSMIMKSDILLKKAYIQSNSFDDVKEISSKVGEMRICVPSIPPVDYEHVYKSSNFGMRLDPVNKKKVRPHNGVDLAPKSRKDGEPVYATGNGVVVNVGYQVRGFGHYVEIDHGFGYRTRYAHLRKAIVEKGQEVKLGQQIAEMGNTGHSSGTHLHYEVIYMNKPVNPVNYYSTDILSDDYASIVASCARDSVQNKG